jgi:hypothetical protein
MANSEYSQWPPRTSSRFPAPGVFVNVEFGVSFSASDRPHTASVSYTSRRMQERMERHQREEARRSRDAQERMERHQLVALQTEPIPPILIPGHGRVFERQTRHEQQQERQRDLHVRTREHERGSSAPPSLSLSDRLQPISPVSPIGNLHHTSSMPIEWSERPLPPVPSRFRLGEEGLPWSTEPWYRGPEPEEPEFATPTMVDIELDDRLGEDPQRVRELESLHQAMMTVDSLSNDGWEPWTWDSVGDMPRGPRSLGWAVRSMDPVVSPTFSPTSPPPPPYVVSQWDHGVGRSLSSRPRSSG